MSLVETFTSNGGIFSLHIYFSFLRSLVPQFNTVAKENLVHSVRLKAEGRTPAKMKEEFSNAALNTISRVGTINNKISDHYDEP